MQINSLWISGPLKPINYLTIKSFQDHGHEFILWSYDLTLDVPCEVRDAREILPESEIFYYKNMNGGGNQWKFGGIAERLKAELLYAIGGWHVDLDVTCLKSFDDLNAHYVFAPHPAGIIGNIIKCPAKSDFAKHYLEHTKTINADNREWTKSFAGLQTALKKYKLEKYIQPISTFGIDEDAYIVPLLQDSDMVPPPSRHAIHWCGAMQWFESFEENSFYESLLQKYNLLKKKELTR